MKLKLTDYVVSGAKRLFRSEAKEYEKTAILIRHRAWRAATRCAALGESKEGKFESSLKEFLAFFCVIAVNEIALRTRRRSDPDLKKTLADLIRAICEGNEPSGRLVEQQASIRRILNNKKPGFEHWFYGYWNADLEGMRITQADLKDLEQKRVPGPTGEYRADAGLILLVRVSRLENADSSIPSAAIIQQHDDAIREEVAVFVKGLIEVLH
jgi:hypothetical protein